jgi:type IV pilus assembly protein PilX
MKPYPPIRRLHRRDQGGIALIIALIVLVIVGLTSASVMRGALSSDLVANNTRVQTLAAQAAQIGLRYCEDKTNVSIVPLLPNPPNQYETLDNWKDSSGLINKVPEDYMQSANSTFKPFNMPQCMVQEASVAGNVVYQVTSRGFSPDYSADPAGNTGTGSVVWLQSTVFLK